MDAPADRVADPTPDAAPLIEVVKLRKEFSSGGSRIGRKQPGVRAVDDVSLTINAGETLGLVGESGSGKTTLGRLMLRLTPATSGEIRFRGEPIGDLTTRQMRTLRRRMQAVFQDPLGSLNPRMTVGELVAEPLRVFKTVPAKEVPSRVEELLDLVGLDPRKASSYPRELSGGQRQRVGIARAVSIDPQFIVADEPVSALDVSVQAQVLNLFVDLRERLGLTYLFITHDLSVVRHVSQRIGVMYMGRLVEIAPTEELFSGPAHPYTVALLDAAMVPDPDARRERVELSEDPPSLTQLPSGCRFRSRCPMAQTRCAEEEPELREIEPGRWSACHFAESVRPADADLTM